MEEDGEVDSRESWKNVSIQGELRKESGKHFEQLKYLKFSSTNSAKGCGNRLSNINPKQVGNDSESAGRNSKGYHSLRNYFVKQDSLNVAVKAK